MSGARAAWTERLTTTGNAYAVWEPELPRAPDSFLEAVFYLYPSADAARTSAPLGGSGFIAGVSVSDGFPIPGATHNYLVTNEHVARRGAPVARVPTWPTVALT